MKYSGPKRIQGTDPQRWEAVVEKTRDLLITRARLGDPPIQYADIVRIVGEPPAWNTYRHVLDEVAKREHEVDRPPVTALVFNKDNREAGTANMPGSSFWELLADLGYDTSDRVRVWEEAKADVYDYWKAR